VQDRVADILAQRATLDRGAGAGVVVSILLHAGLAGALAYTALHVPPPRPAQMVNIQFAKMPGPAAAPRTVTAKTETPVVAQPKAKIEEPKIVEPTPVVQKTTTRPEKNTVPFSPFGRSTKKGSEAPATKPVAAPAAPAGIGAADVPVGGSGVTGLEGGDFPYTLYIDAMHRKIGSNWFRPQVAAGASVLVYFRILRDGTITEAKVETPSGNGTFDRAALSAVRSASPLNPLPFAYSGNYLGVHLTFR
jgi:TonB family protein